MSEPSKPASHHTATDHPSSVVMLKASDLPAFCPNPKMPLWNHHPRVFLDVTHEGRARCPYCGTQYQLEAGAVVHGH